MPIHSSVLLYYIISSGVRELFWAGSGERSSEGNENRYSQMQRQHAHECTDTQHRLSETGCNAVKHTRIQRHSPPATRAPQGQATRGTNTLQ